MKYDAILFGNGMTINLITQLKQFIKNDKLYLLDINDFLKAFGRNKNPDWTDFETFLADRCIPETRAGMQYYLNALGLDEYNPVEIIKKTKGRMAEDSQWLKISELVPED